MTVPQPALRVDTASPVPPYEQIRAQLATLIASGRLPEGHRLPPVRQLATDLGLAAGTVARAYRELEASGLVTTRRAAGTRVARAEGVPGDALRALAARFVHDARALGATDAALLAAVRACTVQGREALPTSGSAAGRE